MSIASLKHLPASWRYALAAFLAARVMASAVAAMAWTTVPANPVVPADSYMKQPWSTPGELLFGVWERADALWYLHLAQDGYQATGGSTAFMPLYPLLVRILSYTGLPPLICALLISNAALLCALAALYRLAELDFGAPAARRAVWYQALFPASFFLLAPYTESLYLALAVGALLAARQGRWRDAALLAALLAATRTVGILMLLALATEFLIRRPPWRQALWLLLVPLGLLAVMAVQHAATGDPLAFMHSQGGWRREPEWPWRTLYEGLRQAVAYAASPDGGIYLFEAAAATYAVALAVGALVELPPSYSVFLWTTLLVPLCSPYAGNMLMSMPRFVAVLFPLHLALALQVRNRDTDSLVRAVMAGLYGLALALYVGSRNMF